jgi:hypothetical protein
MRIDLLKKFLLLMIAISLAAIAVRPYVHPVAARAQSSSDPFYVEPGVRMLRATDGSKPGVRASGVGHADWDDLGFPTYNPDPYPSNGMDTKLQVSHPFVLGKVAFEDTDK